MPQDDVSPGHSQSAPSAASSADSGMSSTAKALIVISVIGGLCALLCCGSGIFVATQVEMEVEEDPQAAEELTRELATINIPPLFEPAAVLRMDMIVMDMRMAMYEASGADGHLVLADADVSFGNREDVEPELRDSMQQAGVEDDENMRVLSSETREFEVRGEPVDFKFARAENRKTGTPYRRVSGAFPSTGDGVGFLWVEIEETYYDERSLVRMINSIH